MASTRPARASDVLAASPGADAPPVRALEGGRYQVRCDRCTRVSIPIPTVDAPHAWAELAKIGWTSRRTKRGAPRETLCPGCAGGGSSGTRLGAGR